MNRRKLNIILFLLFPLLLFGQDEIAFTASSRAEVGLGEQFRIVYELNADGSRFNGPDFEGLRVVTGPMTSTSSSIQIINGQMSRTYSQTYTYVVVATREGEVNLGPATVMVDGKQHRSNALKINVKQTASSGQQTPSTSQPRQQDQPQQAEITDKDLFLRAVVDKREAYVGEQVIITYRLFTRVPISNISVNKLSSFPGFWVKNLLEDRAPLQQSRQVIDGEEYVVADVRKIAIFPQRAGKITIEPMELEATAQLRVTPDPRRPRDPFESFFSDPFFSRNIRNVQQIMVSNAIELEIKPLPFAGRPQEFGGAVGQFSIQASIDRNELKTNEAINLTYTLTGTGNIELVDIPMPQLPHDFEVFEPRITSQARTSATGVSGTRKVEYLLIPRSPGSFAIPAVNFSYFDPRRKEYISLQSQSFTIEVERGTDEAASTGIVARGQEGIRFLGSDIRHIKMNSYGLKPIGSFFFFSLTYFAIILGSVLLFVVALLYYRKTASLRRNQSLLRNRLATKVARRRLKTAHKHMHVKQQNEFYQEMSQALWGYIADKFTISRSVLSFETVKESLASKQAPEELQDDFMRILNDCEFARFAPGDPGEKMEELYKQGIQIISKTERIVK